MPWHTVKTASLKLRQCHAVSTIMAADLIAVIITDNLVLAEFVDNGLMKQKVDVLCIVICFRRSTARCSTSLLNMSRFMWIDALQDANSPEISKSQLEFLQRLVA